MNTSVRVARGMARGRKGRGPRGPIGDADSRSTSGPDPAAEDIRIVTMSLHHFQRFMNTIFGDLLDIILIIYLDDILVFSLITANHTEDVREVTHQL